MDFSTNPNASSEATIVNENKDQIKDTSRFFRLSAHPTITLFGLVGNVLTILIMRRHSFRKLPVSIYLTCLTASDTVFLLAAMIPLSSIQLQTRLPNYVCSVAYFILTATCNTSAWILVCMTASRFISIYFPQKQHTWCSIGRARGVCLSVAVAFCLTEFHIIFTIESPVVTESVLYGFSPKPWAKEFFNVYLVLNGIRYAFLPSLILLALNFCIIHWMLKQPVLNNIQYASLAADTKRITTILLTVAFIFVLTTLTASTLDMVGFIPGTLMDMAPMTTALAEILLGLNSSCTFYVSVLTAKNFRAELKKMLGCDSGVGPQNMQLAVIGVHWKPTAMGLLPDT